VARVDVGLAAPIAGGLIVTRQLALIILEDGDPQAALVEAVDTGEELPSPGNGFLLVIVAKGPVPEHLEEGMVGAVAAHFLQVVVLARHAHALLSIHGTGVGAGAGTQEDILELIHAGVRKQQRRVVLGDEAGAGHNRMPSLGKEVQEGLSDSVGSPVLGHGSPRRPAIGYIEVCILAEGAP